MRARVKHLQQKCASSEAEIERLQLKLRRMSEEEEKRIQKQGQVIQQLRKRTGRSLDDKYDCYFLLYLRRVGWG